MESPAVQADVLNDELERMTKRAGRSALNILETGCIRATPEAHRVGDGWSTLTFAQWVKGHGGSSLSLDLDTSSARTILAREDLLAYAALSEGDSIAALNALMPEGRGFDVVLLDSASDPIHILNEWDRAVRIIRTPGVILIDDVSYDEGTAGTKGSLIIERLDGVGVPWRRLRRWSGFAYIGMIAIDF